ARAPNGSPLVPVVRRGVVVGVRLGTVVVAAAALGAAVGQEDGRQVGRYGGGQDVLLADQQSAAQPVAHVLEAEALAVRRVGGVAPVVRQAEDAVGRRVRGAVAVRRPPVVAAGGADVGGVVGQGAGQVLRRVAGAVGVVAGHAEPAGGPPARAEVQGHR